MNENNNDQWPSQDQQQQQNQQQPAPPHGTHPYGTPPTPYGAPPAYGMPPYGDDTSVMSTKDWVVTYLVMMIPCIGWIMAFVWAFGQGNLNRRNYARAYLIIMGVLLALTIISWIFIAVIIGAAFDTMWGTW